MKAVSLFTLCVLLKCSYGYDAKFVLPSQALSKSSEAAESVTLNAVEASRRICAQYAVPLDFCDTLAGAVEEASDDEELFAIPAKLAYARQENRSASWAPQAQPGSSLLKSILPEISLPESILPENLDVSRNSAWDIQIRNSLSRGAEPKLVLDAVLAFSSENMASFGSGLQRILDVYYSPNIFAELKTYWSQWGSEEMPSSIWDSLLDGAEGFRRALMELKTFVDSNGSAVLPIFMDLAQFGIGMAQTFQASGSSSSFFPQYIAWSSMVVSLFRALVCDQWWANRLGPSAMAGIRSNYRIVVSEISTYGASVENAYNLWFLNNNKHWWAREIRNHFQLRFGFDYAIAVGNSGADTCDFVLSEARAPAAYSAVPLFADVLVDIGTDNRRGVVYDFFTSIMFYSVPKQRLGWLFFQDNEWDQNQSFRGVRMTRWDGSYETCGDLQREEASTAWILAQNNQLCKVRGMRYEYGTEEDDHKESCQWYRIKGCNNKFQADVECAGSITHWIHGKMFKTPNVVIPSAKTRVFSKFLGWRTDNYDQKLQECAFGDSYAIWVTPKSKTHLLDNLLAVYRIDTIDYSSRVPY
eukprot:Gregarina_sp_Pseudo_9__5247@NODE_594_length_2531_cov_661_016051_g560_i0_p1_GENE_NODE_594_length_2531_cov_661_016051_g560_i0NODE_594_length_2531_cov_661_016051_g560_i0_p1_ORF_typecomplete_len584_score102_82_NODE_594_length_2531_cov_661_016051_g560_i03582109